DPVPSLRQEQRDDDGCRGDHRHDSDARRALPEQGSARSLLSRGNCIGYRQQRGIVGQQIKDLRVAKRHGLTPLPSISSRSACSPRTKRISAPSGLTSSAAPISANLAPRNNFKTSTCRCPSGSRSIATRSAAATSAPYSACCVATTVSA